jgi:hypothetical protein
MVEAREQGVNVKDLRPDFASGQVACPFLTHYPEISAKSAFAQFSIISKTKNSSGMGCNIQSCPCQQFAVGTLTIPTVAP